MNRKMAHTTVSVPSSSIRGLPSGPLTRPGHPCRRCLAGQPSIGLLFLLLFGSPLILSSPSAFAAGTFVLPNDALEPLDNFGESVATDGTTMVVGKNGDNTQGLSSGAAYIYELDGSNQWVQVAKVLGGWRELRPFR